MPNNGNLWLKLFLKAIYIMTKSINYDKAAVIIPAFNEEKQIATTLSTINIDSANKEFDVIIICNGCSDNTASIVKENYPDIHLYEIPVASKAAAIQYAESLNIGFPRIYMDADIRLDKKSILALCKASSTFSNKLVLPVSKIDTNSSSYFVRAFYREWYKTDFVKKAGFGSGVYCIGKDARKKFGQWPTLISDDGFVRSQFSIAETVVIQNAISHVKAPDSLWQLIRIKHRSKYGNIQLKKYLKENKINFIKPDFPPLRKTMSVATIIYLGINTIALSQAYWTFLRGNFSWLRDTSSH